MSAVEAFLDETPGEVRGTIVRNGRFERLLIHRESDVPGLRPGARSVGRIVAVDPGLRGAFVDIGAGEPLGFLPLRKADRVAAGARVEVEVTAAPREHKGPTLRLVGAGEGEPRLSRPAPAVAEMLAILAPGTELRRGAAAMRASLEAEEEALAPGGLFAHLGDDPGIVYGPVNRFGVLMLSLPWRERPVEERLLGPDGGPTLETRAIAATRRLALELAMNTTTPWLTLRCAPEEAAAATAFVGRLGPRARIRSDPGVPAGAARVEEN